MLKAVDSITLCEDVTLIALGAVLPRHLPVPGVFDALAQAEINVDMICLSAAQGGAVDLSFTVSDEDISRALVIIGHFEREAKGQCTVSAGNAKLSFRGDSMPRTPGAAASVLDCLARCSAVPKMITTSTVDISILVDAHVCDELCRKIQCETGLPITPVSFRP